jgi:hypothetical protein
MRAMNANQWRQEDVQAGNGAWSCATVDSLNVLVRPFENVETCM